jgi:hypothetical protein
MEKREREWNLLDVVKLDALAVPTSSSDSPWTTNFGSFSLTLSGTTSLVRLARNQKHHKLDANQWTASMILTRQHVHVV